VPLPRLRSTFARAVVPVLGGITVLAAILAATYGLAAWISRDGVETSSRLTPRTLPVGGVESVSETIAETGPILLPGLNTTSGERTLILDHAGEDPTRGWRLYLAHPEGEPSCGVTQVPETSRLLDCDGDEIDIARLARPTDACPIVENRERVLIGLVTDVCGDRDSD
jgi:hypothetical protein